MDSSVHHKKIEEAVGRYVLVIKKKPRPDAKPPKLITISRQIGAGGREIALHVCETLGCLVWGRELLDVLASQAGGNYHSRMFQALDERTQGAIEEVVSEFFGRVGRHTYQYLLPRAILTAAQGDAVFLGRGANLVVPQAFHVRITAPLENRLQTIMSRENLGRSDAERRIRDSDHQREKFLKEFAAAMMAKHVRDDFDLIVNTDRLGYGDAAATILHGYERFRKRQDENRMFDEMERRAAHG